jgi:NADH:ubiquinone oxidoreductase subunit E
MLFYFLIVWRHGMAAKELIVTVCMGSSCFSQGSNEIVSVVEEYIKAQDAPDVKLKLKGCLCLGKCTDGPVVKIGDKEYYKVHSDTVIDLLKEHVRVLYSKGA